MNKISAADLKMLSFQTSVGVVSLLLPMVATKDYETILKTIGEINAILIEEKIMVEKAQAEKEKLLEEETKEAKETPKETKEVEETPKETEAKAEPDSKVETEKKE